LATLFGFFVPGQEKLSYMNHKCWLCLVILALSVPSVAQNTGGVFPPFVNPGFRSLQYRIAVNTENDAGETSVAQRLHYLHAINEDMQWVLFAGARQTQTSDFDFDYLHTGLSFDLSEEGQRYRTGIRFDLRIRDGSRSNHVGVNWMNQYYFESGWTARATFLSAVQFGGQAADGVFLQSRWQLAKRLESGRGIGLEMFSFYGSSDKFGNFDSQNHAVGPTYSVPITSDWSVFTGVLFGISDGAPDTQLRFWLSRSI